VLYFVQAPLQLQGPTPLMQEQQQHQGQGQKQTHVMLSGQMTTHS
jgi:hypothetical protein